MKIIHSHHWLLKRRRRPEITDDLIEYSIINSQIFRDKHWEDADNAICVLPHNGQTLKVVYRRQHDTVKIITAFWIT